MKRIWIFFFFIYSGCKRPVVNTNHQLEGDKVKFWSIVDSIICDEKSDNYIEFADRVSSVSADEQVIVSSGFRYADITNVGTQEWDDSIIIDKLASFSVSSTKFLASCDTLEHLLHFTDNRNDFFSQFGISSHKISNVVVMTNRYIYPVIGVSSTGELYQDLRSIRFTHSSSVWEIVDRQHWPEVEKVIKTTYNDIGKPIEIITYVPIVPKESVFEISSIKKIRYDE